MSPRISLRLHPLTVRALRTSGAFALFTASFLNPDTDRWTILDDAGIVVGGNSLERVEELARRYRRMDAFIARHGTAPFDRGREAALFPEVEEELEAQHRGLRYQLLPSGRRRLTFRAPRGTATLFRGPLGNRARKLGVTIRRRGSLVHVVGRSWRRVLRVAEEVLRQDGNMDRLDGS